MLDFDTKLDRPALGVLIANNRQIMTQTGAVAKLQHPKPLAAQVAESLLGLATPLSSYRGMSLKRAAMLDAIAG